MQDDRTSFASIFLRTRDLSFWKLCQPYTRVSLGSLLKDYSLYLRVTYPSSSSIFFLKLSNRLGSFPAELVVFFLALNFWGRVDYFDLLGVLNRSEKIWYSFLRGLIKELLSPISLKILLSCSISLLISTV